MQESRHYNVERSFCQLLCTLDQSASISIHDNGVWQIVSQQFDIILSSVSVNFSRFNRSSHCRQAI